MPRRKHYVEEMEKYEVRVPSSMTRITLGPMFSDWEAQRSAAGFGSSNQQQWIKHLLEVHSLACNGQGCARMYEGEHGENTVNKSKSKPKGSTSPRGTGVARSRGRSRKGSPHRNMYVDCDVKEDDYGEDSKKDETSDSESTSDSTSGADSGDKSEDKQQASSSSESLENDVHTNNEEITGLQDVSDKKNSNSQDNHENEQTITFEQVDESQLVKKTTEDISATQLKQQSYLSNRLHELYPDKDTQNNMPIDLTTRILSYAFNNMHTPPSSPLTTTSTDKSSLPPTAEYKEVRLRRGNGYYIKEYIYIKNRDCNGKIFLRCQFRASCRARAVVLVDSGRVIVTQGRHTHPPPHPQMIRFGPHIKDISATWANRVAKKTNAQAKNNTDSQRKTILLAKQSRKTHNNISPAVVAQAVTQQQTVQQSIPIVSSTAPAVSIPPTSVIPVTTYKFAPQFTSTQGNTDNAANSIINVQAAQPISDATKVNSQMPLIIKSWSLLKGNQPNNILTTQPLNVLQQQPKTCLVLQPNPANTNPGAGLINVTSQPQVSIAYNFNPAIISQPITSFPQPPLMQRIVVGQNFVDPNATNLSLKDNQFVVEQGITGEIIASPAITTVQPQPTSPLPVQLVAIQPSAPENGGKNDQSELKHHTAENGSTLDLRVGAKPEARVGGKKRANIFSITEKLMKQKQQRLGEDQ